MFLSYVADKKNQQRQKYNLFVGGKYLVDESIATRSAGPT